MEKPTGFIYDYTEHIPLEHLGYPKDDMFKLRLVIDSVDKRTNKPFSVTYDVDFRMPFNE